jgi:hypothetical protein
VVQPAAPLVAAAGTAGRTRFVPPSAPLAVLPAQLSALRIHSKALHSALQVPLPYTSTDPHLNHANLTPRQQSPRFKNRQPVAPRPSEPRPTIGLIASSPVPSTPRTTSIPRFQQRHFTLKLQIKLPASNRTRKSPPDSNNPLRNPNSQGATRPKNGTRHSTHGVLTVVTQPALHSHVSRAVSLTQSRITPVRSSAPAVTHLFHSRLPRLISTKLSLFPHLPALPRVLYHGRTGNLSHACVPTISFTFKQRTDFVKTTSNRSRFLHIRLTPEEQAQIAKAADAHDLTPSEWIRSIALNATTPDPRLQVITEEVVAARIFSQYVIAALVNTEGVTTQVLQQISTKADEIKKERAAALLDAAYSIPTKRNPTNASR